MNTLTGEKSSSERALTFLKTSGFLPHDQYPLNGTATKNQLPVHSISTHKLEEGTH